MNDQQRAAMQMALDYIAWNRNGCDKGNAITALREALAQPVVKDSLTAQMQGEWVDLTDDEMQDCHCLNGTAYPFALAIIAKFKSKNTLPVVPQAPVAYLAKATRFKVCATDQNCMITGLPTELNGRWVALVAAEDDCHLKYTTPPSVEAMRIETLEKVLACYSPDDTANDWADKIKELK